MRTLTVVAPVYNEEEAVSAFYGQVMAVLEGISEAYSASLLFVVDRSDDRTMPVLREIAQGDPRVQVLSLSSRFGHQMSLLAGIDYSLSDAVIMMDADLEHPPALIPLLLKRFEQGYEIVQAIRIDQPDAPLLKRFASSTFYRLINKLSDVPIAASGADFRLISARVASVFREEIRERNQFIRGLVAWVGFNSCHVTYTAGKRVAGTSNYSLTKMSRLAVDGIVAFSRRPLQAAVYIGLLLATLGFAFGVFTVISYFMSPNFPAGWATLSVLVTTFSGVQLIFLGVIGEYIGTIFDEVKRRPHYIVDEAINITAPERRRVVFDVAPAAEGGGN